MTERTIRTLAKELAGQFYEQKRSDRFRSKDALTRAKTLRQLPDGSVIEVTVMVPFLEAYPTSQHYSKGHWPFFVEAARQCLLTMLALPDSAVAPALKEAIYAAILEDSEKKNKHNKVPQTLLQRELGDWARGG